MNPCAFNHRRFALEGNTPRKAIDSLDSTAISAGLRSRFNRFEPPPNGQAMACRLSNDEAIDPVSYSLSARSGVNLPRKKSQMPITLPLRRPRRSIHGSGAMLRTILLPTLRTT